MAQSGPVFFLASTIEKEVTRACPVPCGRALFFALMLDVEIACSTCDQCRIAANNMMSDVSSLTCEVDGVPLENLADYFDESPRECFDMQVPEENFLGLPAGTYETAAAGYWLMLKPLSPGEHILHFKGVSGPPAAPTGGHELTYTLTVGPCTFRRGDVNVDGEVNIADPVRLLCRLFLGYDPLPCEDAADADDNGILELTDAVYTLSHLFLGDPPLPPPGIEGCDEDPSADELPACASGC